MNIFKLMHQLLQATYILIILSSPGANLASHAPLGQFFMGVNLFIRTSFIPRVKRSYLNVNLFGLCENAWFPWKTHIGFVDAGTHISTVTYVTM